MIQQKPLREEACEKRKRIAEARPGNEARKMHSSAILVIDDMASISQSNRKSWRTTGNPASKLLRNLQKRDARLTFGGGRPPSVLASVPPTWRTRFDADESIADKLTGRAVEAGTSQRKLPIPTLAAVAARRYKQRRLAVGRKEEVNQQLESLIRQHSKMELVQSSISVPTMILTATVAGVTWVAWQAMYNIYFHPLARFPGPRAAAATRYWKAWVECFQEKSFCHELEKLHARYGKVVRVGPNEASSCPPAPIDPIVDDAPD